MSNHETAASERFPVRQAQADLPALAAGVRNIPRALQAMGYSGFRKGQQTIVGTIMSGKDAFVILPTGGGKSACFIIPSLCMEWPTIVFSPLQALMRDQVSSLRERGIPAGRVTGDQNESQNQQILELWMRHEIQFMYVAPERIANEAFKMAMRQRPPVHMVVDEAHCFPGDTSVATEFGPRHFLDLWESQKAGHALPRVWSKAADGAVELRNVKSVFRNPARPLVRVKIKGFGTQDCTGTHVWMTRRGEIEASKLRAGDRVYGNDFASRGRNIRGLTDDQLQLVIGSYLGDGGLSCVSASNRTYRLSWTHGWAQKRYCKWKAELLGGSADPLERNGYAGKRAMRGRSLVVQLPEAVVTRSGKHAKKSEVPAWMLEMMDVRALAVWFMDDGSIVLKSGGIVGASLHTESFTPNAVDRLVRTLWVKFRVRARRATTSKGPCIRIGAASARSLVGLVAPYTHEELAYKLGPDGRAGSYEWDSGFRCFEAEVHEVSPITRAESSLFDLEVCDNHNYFVMAQTAAGTPNTSGYPTSRGFLVHNCLAQWSQTFRAAYRSLGDFAREYNPRVISAYTATCPPEAEADIRLVLGLANAERMSFFSRRDNLQLSSEPYPGDQAFLGWLLRHTSGSTLVYCSSIKRVEELAEALSALQPGAATFYHGKLSDAAKAENMTKFMRGERRICVATSAFGMGIDKPDIRWVVHRDIPGTPEDLAQQIGRAGRDDQISYCKTFFSKSSVKTQEFFIDMQCAPEENVRMVYSVIEREARLNDGVCTLNNKDLAARCGFAADYEASNQVSSILTLLTAHGVISKGKDKDTVARVEFLEVPAVTPLFEAQRDATYAIGVASGSLLEVDLDDLADELGVPDKTVRNRFRQWASAGMLRYWPPANIRPIRITGDVENLPWGEVAARRTDLTVKLQAVIKYAHLDDKLKHAFLEEAVMGAPAGE